MTPKEWLTDLAAAAEELGYLIESVGPRSVVLYGRREERITIESVLLSGDWLREALKVRLPDEPAPVRTA